MLPPPAGSKSIPVLAKASEAYKEWHNHLQHIPRLSRYSIGMKIDALFTQLIESLIHAGYATERNKKILVIDRAIVTLNTLKYFLQLIWEINLIDQRKFESLSMPLHEIGKMANGWKKYLET